MSDLSTTSVIMYYFTTLASVPQQPLSASHHLAACDVGAHSLHLLPYPHHLAACDVGVHSLYLSPDLHHLAASDVGRFDGFETLRLNV